MKLKNDDFECQLITIIWELIKSTKYILCFVAFSLLIHHLYFMLFPSHVFLCFKTDPFLNPRREIKTARNGTSAMDVYSWNEDDMTGWSSSK